MNTEILTEIGLSPNEAKVYLALLALGEATILNVYERTSLHRPNIYDSIERLVKKGLVSHIEKGKKRYYTAEHPSKLKTLLKEKEAKLDNIMPDLVINHSLTADKQSAKVFEGIRGIKSITDDILVSEKKEILTFGVPRDVKEKMKNFLSIYHQQRIKKKINQIHIYNENAKDRIAYLNLQPYTKAGYLPKEYSSPVTTTIYADKVAFFIWSEQPSGIMIKSKDMADAYRKYFKLLWKVAKNI